MTDDSIEILEPFPFHPLDTPRGCKYYDFSILTSSQQGHLNDFKANLMRNDEKYLAKNPQIRAIVALVYRHVLKHKPKRNIVHTIGRFFNRPIEDIRAEIQEYLITNNIEPTLSETESVIPWQVPEDYGSYYMAEHQYDTAGTIIDFIRTKECLDEEDSEDGSDRFTFIRGILEGVIQEFPSDDHVIDLAIQSVESSATTTSTMVNMPMDDFYDDEVKIEEYVMSGQDDAFLEF